MGAAASRGMRKSWRRVVPRPDASSGLEWERYRLSVSRGQCGEPAAKPSPEQPDVPHSLRSGVAGVSGSLRNRAVSRGRAATRAAPPAANKHQATRQGSLRVRGSTGPQAPEPPRPAQEDPWSARRSTATRSPPPRCPTPRQARATARPTGRGFPSPTPRSRCRA